MKLTIPPELKVGRRRYRVLRDRRLSQRLLGEIHYNAALIRLTTKRLAREELEETFWHEVVHAIVHDMRSGDVSERFVDAFARRLNGVVRQLHFK